MPVCWNSRPRARIGRWNKKGELLRTYVDGNKWERFSILSLRTNWHRQEKNDILIFGYPKLTFVCVRILLWWKPIEIGVWKGMEEIGYRNQLTKAEENYQRTKMQEDIIFQKLKDIVFQWKNAVWPWQKDSEPAAIFNARMLRISCCLLVWERRHRGQVL